MWTAGLGWAGSPSAPWQFGEGSPPQSGSWNPHPEGRHVGSCSESGEQRLLPPSSLEGCGF